MSFRPKESTFPLQREDRGEDELAGELTRPQEVLLSPMALRLPRIQVCVDDNRNNAEVSLTPFYR